MSFVLDTFTDTDGTLLTSGHIGEEQWIQHASGAGQATVFANGVYGSTAGWVYSTHSAVGEKHELTWKFRVRSKTGNTGVGWRFQTGALSGYTLHYSPGGGYLQASKWTAGSPASLAQITFDPVIDQEYTVLVRITDARTSIYVDGTEIIRFTDITYTTGRIAMWFGSVVSTITGQHIMSIQADDGTGFITAVCDGDTISKDDVTPNTSVSVILTGSGTNWSGTPFSIVSGPAGAAISNQSVASATSASFTLATGTGVGPIVVKDSTPATITFSSTDLRIAIDGNSLTSDGWYSPSNIPWDRGWVHLLNTHLAGRARIYDYAISGQAEVSYTAAKSAGAGVSPLAALPSGFAALYSAAKSKNLIVGFESTNQLQGAATTAATKTTNDNFGTAAKATGWKTICGTPTPRTKATPNPNEATFDVNRLTVRTDLLASTASDGSQPYHAAFDFGGTTGIGALADATPASGTTNYLDGLHWTSAGSIVAESVVVTAIDAMLPPLPPVIGTATPSGTQVTVTYTNVANETGYEIDYSTSSTFASGVTTVTAAADTTSKVITAGTLTASTLYYFRVRATNANGDSLNSATVSATTGIDDTTAPTVTLNSLTYDPVAHTLAVNTKFADAETMMDFLTISGSSSAILITGPGGYSQLMSYYSDDVGMNAATINVLWVKSGFPVTPGTYTVFMVANQVKDTAGNSVAVGTIGTFLISGLARTLAAFGFPLGY